MPGDRLLARWNVHLFRSQTNLEADGRSIPGSILAGTQVAFVRSTLETHGEDSIDEWHGQHLEAAFGRWTAVPLTHFHVREDF